MTSTEAMEMVKVAGEAASNEETTKEELVAHVSALCDTLTQAVGFIDVLHQEMDQVSALMGLLCAPPPGEDQPAESD